MTLYFYDPVFILGAIGIFLGHFINRIISAIPNYLQKKWGGYSSDSSLEAGSAKKTIPTNRWTLNLHQRKNFNITFQQNTNTTQRWSVFRYMLVTIASIAILEISYMEFRLSALFFYQATFLLFLLSLSFIDIETQLLPDILTFPLLAIGIFTNLTETYTDIASSITGAILGYAILWLVFQVFKVATGVDGMGYGDFKLTSAIGAWIGWQLLPSMLFIAACSGLMFTIFNYCFITQRTCKTPFGPHLAIASLILIKHPELPTHILSMVTQQ